jgi:threonine/homoserine/homoserine lactone efflux protein
MAEKLLLVIGVTALCMLSPGPDMALVMRNTLTQDRRRGGLTALGVLTGNLVHIGYCVMGIALLLTQSRSAFTVLRIASAVYLAMLGVQNLLSHRSAAGTRYRSDVSTRSAYWQGVLNNLLNPKGSLFYLGVFSTLITPEMSRGETALLITVMLAVSAAFWLVFVQSLHLSMIRSAVHRWAVPIERAFGVVLILIAAQVAMLK